MSDPATECGKTYCNGARMCIAPCASDFDCKTGNYCAAGTCTVKQVNGTSCGAIHCDEQV